MHFFCYYNNYQILVKFIFLRRSTIKRRTIIISLILTLSILFVSILPTFAESVTALDVNAETLSESKICKKLYEKVKEVNDDELIPVFILLHSLEQSAINKTLYQEYNIYVEQYDDKARYYQEIVPELLIDNKKISDVVNVKQINSYYLSMDNENSPIDINTRRKINQSILQNQDYYLKCYRQCIKELNSEYKNQFINEYKSILGNTVETFSVACVISQIEKKNLYKLASDNRVEYIEYFENVELEQSSWSSLSVTESDSVTGLGSSYYNYGNGFDGTGISIGIVEALNARFDPNDYNLSDMVTSGQLTFVQNPFDTPAQIDFHATGVTTLICGKKTVIGGKTYEGVAKGATVYQTNCTSVNSLFSALDELVYNYNVKVINLSLGFPAPMASYGEYNHEIDGYVDRFIADNKVSIVVASGNEWAYVNSPAKAYRTIAVGAIAAKATNNTLLSAPYNMVPYSCYLENNDTNNKPDIVAPGLYIRIPYSETSVRKVAGNGGTSYAAPIVTGIAAEIMQVQPYAVSNPLAAKTYLLCGASSNSVAGTTTVCGALTDESGAGLANAVHSIGYNFSYNNASEFFGMFGTIVNGINYDTYSTKYSIILTEGEHVRVVLVFNTKPYNNYSGKDDMDLRLILNNNSSVSLIASAESEFNNVELIDIVAPVNGTYSIQTRLAEHIFDQVIDADLRYWIAWRTY